MSNCWKSSLEVPGKLVFKQKGSHKWYVWSLSPRKNMKKHVFSCCLSFCSHVARSGAHSTNLPWSKPEHSLHCGGPRTNLFSFFSKGVLHLWPLSNSWRGAGNFSDPFAFGRLTSARRTVPSKDVIFKKFRVFTSKAWHSRVSVAYYHITNPCAHAVSPFFPQKLVALTTTQQIGENWLEIDRNRQCLHISGICASPFLVICDLVE